MEILYLKEVDSTQKYLKEYLKETPYTKPIAIVSQNQTNGIGSRNNQWQGEKGNLFFSFAIDTQSLPKDLELQSASIYFSYLLKEVLAENNSKIFLKWPNDFYLGKDKVGGTITSIQNGVLICGIGLNMISNNKNLLPIDIKIEIDYLLKYYFLKLNENILWKKIFSKYTIEFHKNKEFLVTIDSKKVSLKNAILNDDGSLTINNKKVFSLR